MPLVAAGGRILGTFGTYSRDPRSPRPEERSLVEGLARIAVQIIERFRASAPPPRRPRFA